MMTDSGWLAGAMGAKKKAEAKLQGIGRSIRGTVGKGIGAYSKAVSDAAASPRGLKARQNAYYEGAGGLKPMK